MSAAASGLRRGRQHGVVELQAPEQEALLLGEDRQDDLRQWLRFRGELVPRFGYEERRLDQLLLQDLLLGLRSNLGFRFALVAPPSHA